MTAICISLCNGINFAEFIPFETTAVTFKKLYRLKYNTKQTKYAIIFMPVFKTSAGWTVYPRCRGADVLLPQENGRIQKDRSDFAAVYYLCGGRQAYCLYRRRSFRRPAHTNSLLGVSPNPPFRTDEQYRNVLQKGRLILLRTKKTNQKWLLCVSTKTIIQLLKNEPKK